ncbi:uncharacterized protein LOC110038114 [Phalaenopsis equestris]|uniref:uncharacterized protein LOC110038114 n=1 Tax=Phalaenopsis equestris TaxID=78828 RepID=UPI0009E52E0E|nr:uncharacterized protein LOC110038114 [Phalaenopsis equestris]
MLPSYSLHKVSLLNAPSFTEQQTPSLPPEVSSISRIARRPPFPTIRELWLQLPHDQPRGSTQQCYDLLLHSSTAHEAAASLLRVRRQASDPLISSSRLSPISSPI